MRLLCTFLAVAITICLAHPGGDYGEYVYPSYHPDHAANDDFAHRFHYKEYFPTPHEIGVGSGILDSKLYAGSHAYHSIGDKLVGKAQYITSGIGHHLSNAAHAIKDGHSAVSDHIGGKISSLTSAVSHHFKGHFDNKDAYADGYAGHAGHGGYPGPSGYYDQGGVYGHDGHSKLGAVAHGIGETLSGPIDAIKHVHAGISDKISYTAQNVKEGLGSAAHTIQVAHSDLSDHLSRSAVHVKNGISGTISGTTHTAKTLFGILSEFLGKKVQIISEGASKQYQNTKHALSETNAAIYRHIGNKALGVGEFFKNKAHEINYTIQKKLNRDHEHAPYVQSAPIKEGLQAFTPEKLQGFGGLYPGGAVGSSYSKVIPADGGAHGGAFGEAYAFHQPTHLFQPTKVAVEPVAAIKLPPIPVHGGPQYYDSSYTKM